MCSCLVMKTLVMCNIIKKFAYKMHFEKHNYFFTLCFVKRLFCKLCSNTESQFSRALKCCIPIAAVSVYKFATTPGCRSSMNIAPLLLNCIFVFSENGLCSITATAKQPMILCVEACCFIKKTFKLQITFV